MDSDSMNASRPPEWVRSLSTQPDVDKVIASEETKIKQIQQTIRHLKAHRNMLAGISRLPPELLGEVFVHFVQRWNQDCLQRICNSSRLSQDKRRKQRHWIRITEVCHHWRNVALRTPRIWGLILLDQTSLEVVELCLSRSGRTPLDIVQVHPGVLSKLLTAYVVLHFHHTRTISFTLSDEFFRLVADCPAYIDAPLLQRLDIKAISASDPPPLASLANASWPQLTSLTCQLLSSEFLRALARPTLTTLIVRDVPAVNNVKPDIVSWVQILRNLPSLEILDLREVIHMPEGAVHLGTIGMQTTLPCIRRLRIVDNGTGASSASLFNHLVVPAEASIYLSGRSPGPTGFYTDFWTALAQKASGKGVIGQPRPIRILRTSTGRLGAGPVRVTCTMYSDDVSLFRKTPYGQQMETTTEEAACLTVDLYGRTNSILLSLLATYPLSEVHGIEFDYVALVDEDAWRCLSALPRLRQLGLAGDEGALRMLLRALSMQDTFPALEWLELAAFTWNRRHATPWKRRTRLGSLMLEFIGALEARQAQGRRIKMLDLPSADNVFRRDGMLRDAPRIEALVDEFAYTPEEKVGCDTCAEDDEDDVLVDTGDEDEDESTTDEESEDGDGDVAMGDEDN